MFSYIPQKLATIKLFTKSHKLTSLLGFSLRRQTGNASPLKPRSAAMVDTPTPSLRKSERRRLWFGGGTPNRDISAGNNSRAVFGSPFRFLQANTAWYGK